MYKVHRRHIPCSRYQLYGCRVDHVVFLEPCSWESPIELRPFLMTFRQKMVIMDIGFFLLKSYAYLSRHLEKPKSPIFKILLVLMKIFAGYGYIF